MKLVWIALLALQSASPPPAPVAEQAFFALGHAIASEFHVRDAEIAPLLEGVGDVRAGEPPAGPLKAPPPPNMWSLRGLRATIAREEEEGAAFTDNFAKQTGRSLEANGMVFLEQAAGAGRSPTARDQVTVHYTAASTSLRTFEYAFGRNRGQPVTFPVRALVPCWQEALARMKPRGRALFVCPGALAHKEAGRSSPEGYEVIPPGATVVYAVELLDVAPARDAADPPPPPPEAAVDMGSQYAFGYRLGSHILLDDEDVRALERGLRAGARGEAQAPPDDATREAHQALLQERRARAAKRNREAGKAYATKAAREKGAIKTRSGLVFLPLAAGEGAPLTDETQAKIAVRGRLPNRAEVHTAVEGHDVRWGAVAFLRPPCLREAARLMRPAGRARVVCPADPGQVEKGFIGPTAASPLIPGGATLVYELEVVEVRKPGGG